MGDIRSTDSIWGASTEHSGFLDAPKSLHDANGFLDALLGLQLPRVWVGRRKVAIPAQPILSRSYQRKCVDMQFPKNDYSSTSSWPRKKKNIS